MLTIEKLSDIAGARVQGVDLSRPLAPEVFERIEQALHEHCFIVLQRQTLTPAQFVAFARHWGRPEPHVIDTFHCA